MSQDSKKSGFWWGVGRRKTAIARVRVKEGSGRVLVNGKPLEEYFPLQRHQLQVQEPLRVTKTNKSLDVWAGVNGGGYNGQVDAMRMGISRALTAIEPDHVDVLRENSLLTRDARMVERKKYGHKKARKSFQFSKR